MNNKSKQLKIGCAEIEVAPPPGISMAGYMYERRATGVHDPVGVHAMVIENGAKTVALVSCDFLSLKRSTVVKARRSIMKKTDIPAANVAVWATHTHSAPQVTNIFQTAPSNPDYIKKLEDSIVEAVVTAYADRRPASLLTGAGIEPNITFNRRYVMRDGTAGINPIGNLKEVLHIEGPIDPEVGITCVKDENETVLGCFVNYACHATAVCKSTEITADYPGYLARELKKEFGPQCVALFANGACGNLTPVDAYNFDWDRNTGHDCAARIGKALGDVVRTEFPNLSLDDDITCDTAHKVLNLPIREIPDSLLKWAKKNLENSENNTDRLYAAETLSLMQEKKNCKTVETEIQVVRIGSTAMVMVPAELFVELGLEIKLRSPFRHTFIVELANGIVGYVPTGAAFDRGGYETRTAESSKLGPAAGEIMVRTAIKLLNQVYKT